jgi:hypothetical protein
MQREGSGGILTHAGDHRSNKLNTSAELRQLRPIQFPDRTRQPRDTTCAPSGENLMAFRSCFDVRQPSVVRIIFPLHEIILLETRHYPRHRRRLHLLGASESSECKRTTEDDDRESRKPGSRESAGVILFPQLPQ